MVDQPYYHLDTSPFARFTFDHRYPGLLQDLIHQFKNNTGLSSDLQILKNQLKKLRITQLIHSRSKYWQHFYQQYLGKTLTEIPFLYAEIYLFAYVNHLFKVNDYQIDPFGYKKNQEFIREKETLHHLIETYQSNEYNILLGLKLSLNGNTADLSQLNDLKGHSLTTIIDDSETLLTSITHHDDIHIILDNSGIELICDLLLGLYIAENYHKTVTLHFKSEPIFVSDALEKDLWYILTELDHAPIIQKIKSLEAKGKLVLTSSEFWSSPGDFNQLPRELSHMYHTKSLWIIKGDANYRRAFQDRAYAMRVSPQELTKYMNNSAYAIRVLKSDILVGYNGDIPADPKWTYNGKYGIIQQIT